MPSLPDNLHYKSTSSARIKLKLFREAGADKLHVLFDFDRTLTVNRPGTNDDITTWHIMKNHLPERGQARYQELFKHYRALELSGLMNQNQAITWWSSILNLFTEYKVNIREVEHDFLGKATIRPYAKELFDLCAAHNIPTIILSAGIKDIIEIWAKAYGIRPAIIHATELNLDTNGVIQGWNKDSLVHILNKKERGGRHNAISEIRRQRPMTLLVGDSPGDADMAEGEESVFRVLIRDPRADEKHTYHTQSLLFDATIVIGDLRPIIKLLKTIAG